MRLEFYIKNGTEFSIVCQLIQMIISTSPNTSPVRRGYSMLKIIFKKGGQFETRNYGDHGKYAFIGVLKPQ